jgi:hypothetical protein
MGIVERCLASPVAKAMEDKCEADSGRHRNAVTFRRPPVKVVIAAYNYAHRFLCALNVATRVKHRGGDPCRPRTCPP